MSPVRPGEGRDPWDDEDPDDPRGPREPEGPRDPWEPEGPRDPWEPDDPHGPRDPWGPAEAVDPDRPRRSTPAPAPRPRVVGEVWATGAGVPWTIGISLALLVVGAVAGRPDVALVGAAPLAASLWALCSRPRGPVWLDVERTPSHAGTLSARLHVAAPPGTDAVRLRVRRPGHGSTEALVDVPLHRTLEVTATSVRTGPQDLFGADHQGLGGGGHLTGPPGRTPAGRVTVLPRPGDLPALVLPERLRGLTGQHGSRRPGEGGDLRDVHPYGPGDSLRRVDWRATARRSPGLEELYVRRTFALAEALVSLVVDSRDDVGPDPGTWSGMRPVRPDDATSLDLARRAAATVAQAYLASGDRVALQDLGVRRRTLRPGTGRRQLDRMLHQLAVMRPEGDPPRRVRAPLLPAGSLVVLFSTFLDPEPLGLVLAWRRAGHRVLAVDVLPRLRLSGLDQRGHLALRVVGLERDDRLADVVTAGAELVRWADDDLATQLGLAARRSQRRPAPTGMRSR